MILVLKLLTLDYFAHLWLSFTSELRNEPPNVPLVLLVNQTGDLAHLQYNWLTQLIGKCILRRFC